MEEKYNDENVRKILESEQIPEILEPENIKKLLDDTNAAERRKRIKHGKIMRVTSAAAALALVIGTSAYFAGPAFFNRNIMLKESSSKAASMEIQSDGTVSVVSMKPAVKYSDIYSYFFAASNVNKFKAFISGGFSNSVKYDIAEAGIEEEFGAMNDDADFDYESEDNITNGASYDQSVSSADTDTDRTKNDYSDTYNQEDGVLEADIVKTDGDRIFYANNDTLCMAKADKGKFSDSYRTSIADLLGLSSYEYSCNVNDMYIYNDKLVLISGVSDYNYGTYDCCYSYACAPNEDTYVMIVNIGDRLTLDGYFIQDGYYNDVRLMSDGYMYIVTNDQKYLDFKNTTSEDIETYIPRYCVNGEYECVPADDVLIPKDKLKEVYDYVSYMNFAGLNLNSAEPWQPVDMKSVAGYSNNIYCSQKNLYVVSGYDETEITRFSLEKGVITPAVSGKVKGYIKDQFSMSEYGGYFRIATTQNMWEERLIEEENSSVASNTMISRNNYVYVLDMDMKVIGSISDFGLNEEIKSVNFSGNTAYVVTFRNTDPLYAIDLSDPASPKILDELKISGFSTYMQKWTDGLLVGFGSEADENTGGVEGVKLTLFDNSDPNDLKALDSVSIVENELKYVYSEGTYERKALYIDPDRNIIGFPVEEDYYYMKPGVVECSYMFYSCVDGKLVYKGKICKTVSLDGYIENFRRVVYIDGYIYAVSGDMFKSADAVNFEEADFIVFEKTSEKGVREEILYD